MKTPALATAVVFGWAVCLGGERIPDVKPRLTFIGHATVLLEGTETTLLTDPFFKPNMLWLKRRVLPSCTPAEIPPLDAVLISHTHPDHFDTVRAISLSIVAFCSERAEAFRYRQEIAVSKSGLVQARLPFETMEKARCREEIRLFNAEGEEMPLVIQGLELGGTNFADVPAEVKYRILEDRSILTFSIPGKEMDGFDLGHWGKTSEKPFTIERSSDGESWTKLYEGIFSRRFMVGFPPTHRRFFRVAFSDKTSPPLTDVRVRFRRPGINQGLELMPVSFTSTTGSPFGPQVIIRPRSGKNIWSIRPAHFIKNERRAHFHPPSPLRGKTKSPSSHKDRVFSFLGNPWFSSFGIDSGCCPWV